MGNVFNESALKMKLWHAANIYWLILLAYVCYRIYNYSFDTSDFGPVLTWGLITVVVLAAIIMIGELQFAWYIWLKDFHKKKR